MKILRKNKSNLQNPLELAEVPILSKEKYRKLFKENEKLFYNIIQLIRYCTDNKHDKLLT